MENQNKLEILVESKETKERKVSSVKNKTKNYQKPNYKIVREYHVTPVSGYVL